ncbi:MAG: EAL domain-containing protein [Gammaproteobacteria bacterium]|nr:EAL domain-containing protein [Gammaproteobacteria bacterium]NND38224.1 EAL domain-containing protein [Pseudomonadales bacterium]
MSDGSNTTKNNRKHTLASEHATLLWVVVGVCLLPKLLNFFGADFSAIGISLHELHSAPGGLASLVGNPNLGFEVGKGPIIHALLEWTAVMVAFFTAIVAFSHFFTDKQNNAASVIGIALLTCGAMEGFHALTSLRIVEHTRDHVDFMPFTWSLARTFNAAIFMVCALICLRYINRKVHPGQSRFDVKLMLTISGCIVLFAFILMRAAAVVDDLPQTLYAEGLFKRPFEIAPILIFIATTPLLLRLYRRMPTMLNATLAISIIPHITLELYMLFGSAKLFDNSFIVAHTLKIFAYGLPFYGLVHSYIRAYQRVNHAYYNDSLTAAANRNYFYLYAETALSRAARENKNMAIFYMDLNGFKEINDTHGHEAGDDILKAFAKRVQSCIRSEDCFARMGGDEFVVTIYGFEHIEFLRGIAKKISLLMKEPVPSDSGPLYVSVSIGISIFADERDLNQLLHNADLAMYEAKRKTSDHICFFSDDMSDAHCDTLQLQSDLANALDNDEFYLVYQPVYESGREEPTAFEALIRWKHPQRGDILPDQFISIAERSGLIADIDSWVMETACAQIAEWRELSDQRLRLFINCSAAQFADNALPTRLAGLMEKHQLEGKDLTLEIGEDQLVECAASCSNQFLALRRMGIGIAMDNYGAGSAAVSHLHSLPIDTIKIDKSLVNGSTECGQAKAIVRSTIELASDLGLNVVAEGVQSIAEFNLLRQLGCSGVQGLFLAAPMRSEKCAAIWAKRKKNEKTANITELLGF